MIISISNRTRARASQNAPTDATKTTWRQRLYSLGPRAYVCALPRAHARGIVCRRTISDENQIEVSTPSSIKSAERPGYSDFEETWKRHLSSAPEKAATVATVATRDRGNVAAVADVAASKGATEGEDGEGLDL